MSPWRRGIVVIASAYSTEDPEFESHQGVRFLGIAHCSSVLCVYFIEINANSWRKNWTNDKCLHSNNNIRFFSTHRLVEETKSHVLFPHSRAESKDICLRVGFQTFVVVFEEKKLLTIELLT
jgi:hypothetical protein